MSKMNNETWVRGVIPDTDIEQIVKLGHETVSGLIAEVKRLRRLRDEVAKLMHIDEINSKCTQCGKVIDVPEGEVWSLGCWECYLEQEPEWREGDEE